MFHACLAAAVPELLFGGGSRIGLVLAFLVAAAVVVLAGTKLSEYGDALGERTGLGAGLVGLIFLAAVTSLPELVVSTTSTLAASWKAAGLPPGDGAADLLLQGGTDLAVGNMIGSNVFNLMLFVVMDLVQGRGAFIHRLSRNHVMAAASGLGLGGVLLFGMAICGRAWGGTGWTVPVLDIGPVTPLLFVAYLAAMVLQGKLENREDGMDGLEPETCAATPEHLLTMKAVRFYGILAGLAALIVLGGMWLSVLGDRIALPAEAGGFGLGQSFVGTIFLAISTSLPELVVCIAAVRQGFFNMAVGNVLGSNIFNLVIVFTADLGLRGGSILHLASPAHLVTIGMVTMLTCVVLVGLVYRSSRSAARIGFDVWIMLAIYILGNIALYAVSAAQPAGEPEVRAVEAIQGNLEPPDPPDFPTEE